MKRIISLTLIAASLFAVSCSKEMGTGAAKNKVTLGASLEQQQSEARTSLGESNTVVWTAQDKLSVLSSTNSTGGDKFTLQTGAGAVSGTFTGELSAADNYYAVYPYSESAKLEGENIVLNIPAEQTYVAGSFANNANVSIAPFTAATAGELSFLNVFGVFNLQLKGNCSVTKIKLTDLDGSALNGIASIATSSVISSNPTTTITNGTASVTLNCSSPVALSTTTTTPFYFVVPVGAFEHGFRVKVYRTDGFNTLLTINPNIIKRSTILQMPARALGDAETVVDLSEQGNSNCYVVPEAGTYKFFAKSKGNATSATLTPKNAILIWEENHSATAPSAAGTIVGTPTLDESGYVIFTTTGTPGNALIAVTDGSDILWSWHLWCVSDLADKGPFPNGKYCIDRELGALSSEKGNALSSGLRYQWGRKDPFMGPANYLSSSSTEYGAKYSNGYCFVNYEGQANDVATSIKNPTTCYIKSTNSWLSPGITTLWGDSKTIYDPCPVGYKVAPFGTWDGLDIGNWSTGRTLSYNSVDLGFFPASGYRDVINGVVSSVAGNIYCWSSTSINKDRSYCLNSNLVVFYSDSQSGTAFSLPVRCCKE